MTEEFTCVPVGNQDSLMTRQAISSEDISGNSKESF